MASPLLRSVLYVPAANARAMARAPVSGADQVILDLEDSVAPERKVEARAALRGYAGPPPVVRVNAADTPWHAEDVAAALASGAMALLLPKASSAEECWTLRRLVATHRPAAPPALWAMIETPRGVLEAAAIAGALGPGGALVLGLNDLARLTSIAQEPGRAPMQAVLTSAVLAARAHDLAVLDGVHGDLDDAQGFVAECREGRRLGFDGKTLIHPSQVGPANAVFSPTPAETAQAEAIVSAFARPENRDRGVILVEGRMVERLHLAMAERLLAKAKLVAAARPAAGGS